MEVFTFTVQVDHTDRSRRPDGRYRTFWTFVEVKAPTDTEAVLVAAQMVHTLRPEGMVLATEIIEVTV